MSDMNNNGETVFPVKMAFRPECGHDVAVLNSLIPEFDFTTPASDDQFPDAQLGAVRYDVTVFDRNELLMLLRSMASIEDGHRMWQTLDTAENYTGDFISGEEEREARILSLVGQDPGTDYIDFVIGLNSGTPQP